MEFPRTGIALTAGSHGGRPAGGGGSEQPGLSTRKDAKLGEIVVDKNGMTVYRFMKDSPWPMKTACTGACLEKWPVVEPVDAKDTKGIDLHFTATVWIQQSAGSKKFYKKTIKQTVPIAIFPSNTPTQAESIPVNAN